MRLYDSLTREVRQLVPVEDGLVKVYSCGPTVYRYIHIGNMRSFMLGDLLRRALRFEGYDVRWVMNITDVGHMTDEVSDTGRDKMELAEADEGLSSLEIAEKYSRAFLEDADLLNIERADVYPQVDGFVYYDVTTFPGYGKLSGNTLDRLRTGHRDIEPDPRKRHPEDFALWKDAGHHRILKWPSPWGEGYPGWHIECSAMSMKHLGERFDVHTGGNDNKFPHHEDEIAQSEGATGHQVVSIWIHGGFLQMGGKKMAKSERNVYRVVDLLEHGIDPLAYRLLCLGTRYRSEMDFSWETLEGANGRLATLRQRVADWAEAEGSPTPDARRAGYDARFREAVTDDMNFPHALVVLNELVASDLDPATKAELLLDWDRVLGLELGRVAAERWEPSVEVLELVAGRDEARAAKDYASSDAIRRQLQEMGLEVMDTPEGTRVRRQH
jgi:cysteinyl-tRNA synthetase